MGAYEFDYDLALRFGRNLFMARRRAGLSQEELASTASLHRTEIGLLERGGRVARIDTLLKLAGALELPPGDLLDGMAWVPAAPAPSGQFVSRGT
ncbi:MAG: helix-turn-helix transcriptional regulator [Solirubrobacterales bacterium]